MQDTTDLDDFITEAVRKLEREPPLTVGCRQMWVDVQPHGTSLPPHGWKFHISARPANYRDLLSTLVPFLVGEHCAFKFARSRETLVELNDGVSTPPSVGKAVTIYPDQARVRELGHKLARLLQGMTGPRVLSDRRLSRSAPVYYRYGAFKPSSELTGFGRPTGQIDGPNGERFDGFARTEYRQPPWVSDPFEAERQPDPATDLLIGDHYRVTEGVRESARGNVYRAIDLRSGRTVIIKQARALLDESTAQVDARLRLRNERRVLDAAAGMAGIPAFIDHFMHGDDEFLVLTDRGFRNLAADIEEEGAYDPTGGERDIARLGTDLARILADLHASGIVMHDLAPKNIVVAIDGAIDGDGDHVTRRYNVVDFGLSAYDGIVIDGQTPAYAPPRQVRGEPPQDIDDIYALGMSLLHALTGVPPTVLQADPGVSRRRALEHVRHLHGDRPRGVVAAVVDLVGDDAAARSAFACWLGGDPASYRPVESPLPAAPMVNADFLERTTTHLLEELLGQVDILLSAPADAVAAGNGTVFNGYAGIGLELLRHTSHPGVPGRLHRLRTAMVSAMEAGPIPPGLFLGSSGTAYFLQMADSSAVEGGRRSRVRHRPEPSASGDPDDLDLFSGHAGVGLAHLWLERTGSDSDDLAIAHRCAELLAAAAPAVSGLGHGLAHGLAGVVVFQTAYAARTGSTDAAAAASANAEALVVRTDGLLATSGRRGGDPLKVASWCNGLTGVARALLYAGRALGEPDCTRKAISAAEAASRWFPKMAGVGQCCGAAGIGELLIDVAEETGQRRYRDLAMDVARHMMLRSVGSAAEPRFLEPRPEEGSASWANGLAGILGFFRRLHEDGAPRIVPDL